MAISFVVAPQATWASGGFSNSLVAVCPGVTELAGGADIDALIQAVKGLPADVVSDEPRNDNCEPPSLMTMAMSRAAPLCRAMGVETAAVFLAHSELPNAPPLAVIGYMLPYGDDSYRSVVTHLQHDGFVRVDGDPYPELTFRKKRPSWELDDFYRRGELYVSLQRDTDFKHFTVAVGSAAAIRLMSRDVNTCH
ncbi:hypothetical protein WKR88_23340 [Trinickia caryophylli]|uniref:hypothetical protein n=1 Tax=Trinickia caryophylli TaxID=28094 RepID=UPI00111BCE72|nr:hypothetical protein [Trinickia caryophylli]TRX19098.1 hypothetical protein FNF07_13220 [Trinickia caryophylli]WQE10102.1 hypothetical protein U0034_09710 [Trinickia caryophylli]